MSKISGDQIKKEIADAWEQALKDQAEGKPLTAEEQKNADAFRAAMKASKEDGKDRVVDFNGLKVTIRGGQVDFGELFKEKK